MDVKLVMFKVDNQCREFPLVQAETTIGRSTECELRIPLASTSRRHCQLIIEGDQLTVRDLASTNGTFLNNRRVQEAKLNAGDVLVIGPVIFTVVIDGQPAKIKPIPTMLTDKTIEPVIAPHHETQGTVDVESPPLSPMPEIPPAMEAVEAVEEINLDAGLGEEHAAEHDLALDGAEGDANSDPLAALQALNRPPPAKK